jgi:uncharacterized protein with GYD domain
VNVIDMVKGCVLMRTERGRYASVLDEIRKIPGVTGAYPVLGRFDVVAYVSAKDPSSMGSSIMRMSRMSGVVFTESLIEVTE